MKKKILAVIFVAALCLALAACGSSGPDITIDDVTAAVQKIDSDFAFDTESKPYFEMIGAKDGWIGYVNEKSPIKVYEYESEGSYKKALETFGDTISDWPKKGNFVLECSVPEVVEAFNSLA